MKKASECRKSRIVGSYKALKAIIGIVLLGLASSQCWAYSGGQGTLQLPYVLSSPEDLIQLGMSSGDYDKHFVLMADIDLAGLTFGQALIAPTNAPSVSSLDSDGAFTGTIDGNGHVISNLTVAGGSHLGLVGVLMFPGQILGVGLVDANVKGTGHSIGILVGHNDDGHIRQCFALGTVVGESDVGGLAGRNYGTIDNSFARGSVSGINRVGGLTGRGWPGDLLNSYSTCLVQSESDQDEGGLSGHGNERHTSGSFWDVETSGISSGTEGTGLTTALMQEEQTYLQAGWDFVGESQNGSADIWFMPVPDAYPELSLFYGMRPPSPFHSGVALGRCTISEDPNRVMWNGFEVIDATWDYVSRTEAIANPAKHPSLDPNNKTRTITINGTLDVLGGQNLLGIDARNGVVCQVLGEQGEPLALNGRLSPFEPSFCWAILPETSQPFELQFQLDSNQPVPSYLSQVDFYVFSLDCDLLTTIDVPFETMDTWKALVPGFEMMIENVVVEDGKWEYTLKERKQGQVVESPITPERTLCDITEFGLSGSGRLVSAPRLWDVDVIFNRNIVFGESHTSKGGHAHGRGESIDGFYVTTTTRSSTGYLDISKIQYTFALCTHKRIVPLTIKDIPMP